MGKYVRLTYEGITTYGNSSGEFIASTTIIDNCDNVSCQFHTKESKCSSNYVKLSKGLLMWGCYSYVDESEGYTSKW